MERARAIERVGARVRVRVGGEKAMGKVLVERAVGSWPAAVGVKAKGEGEGEARAWGLLAGAGVRVVMGWERLGVGCLLAVVR